MGLAKLFGNTRLGNFLHIDNKGQLRLHGEATQWDDLRFPLSNR